EDAVPLDSEAVVLLIGECDFRIDPGDAVVVLGFPCELERAARLSCRIGGEGDGRRHFRNEHDAPFGDGAVIILDAHMNRAREMTQHSTATGACACAGATRTASARWAAGPPR